MPVTLLATATLPFIVVIKTLVRYRHYSWTSRPLKMGPDRLSRNVGTELPPHNILEERTVAEYNQKMQRFTIYLFL